MTLSPVLHVASGQWMLGQVLDRNARPLTKEEIEAHITQFNGFVDDLEESCKEINQLHDALGFSEKTWFDNKGFHNPQEDSIERIRDLVAKEGELGDAKAMSKELADALRMVTGINDDPAKGVIMRLSFKAEAHIRGVLQKYDKLTSSDTAATSARPRS